MTQAICCAVRAKTHMGHRLAKAAKQPRPKVLMNILGIFTSLDAHVIGLQGGSLQASQLCLHCRGNSLRDIAKDMLRDILSLGQENLLAHRANV
eukprot:6474771-Amphidinium_carterae.1